jgi:hypothetical protein
MAYHWQTRMAEPQIRASWPKFVLRCAKQVTDVTGSSIVAGVSEELRRAIREIGHLGWHDARIFMDLLGIIDRATGEVGSRAFWRASFKEAITQPLIAPLARGALAMWGSSPGSLIRRTPEAWVFFTRNCGTLRTVPAGDENAIILQMESLAPICRAPSFLHMAEGGLHSEMDYVGATGTVETRADRFESEGLVEFVVRWQNRSF